MFCRATYGLKPELIQNIEDLFFMFLKDKRQDLVNYDIVAWQQYFIKHGSVRTICIDCSTAIEKFYLKVKKEMQKHQLKKENKLNDDYDDDERVEDSDESAAGGDGKKGGLEKRK